MKRISESDLILPTLYLLTHKEIVTTSELITELNTKDGHINCHACSFEFRQFYGDIGKDYIEIHHLVPICEYQGETKTNIDDAIENVVPLCANCHRVAHLHKPILSVQAIKDAIACE